VTDPRDKVSTDPGIGPVDLADGNPSQVDIATALDSAALYYQPQLLIPVSDHKTLELETIKLSDEIDPRKQVTELRLPRSPLPPPFDSGWPPADVVLTSSQRPQAPARRWRTPLVLFGLLGALLLLVVARAVAHRNALTKQTASAARPVPVVLLTLPVSSERAPKSKAPTVATSGAAIPPSAAAPAPALTPTSVAASSVAPVRAGSALSHGAPKSTPPLTTTSTALPASASAKPKRAIY